MAQWQVTFTSAAGQVMTFGLKAPDETSAFQRGLREAPFTPEKFSVTEIQPPCQLHGVRHHCEADL
jgi:hypothetical protein